MPSIFKQAAVWLCGLGLTSAATPHATAAADRAFRTYTFSEVITFDPIDRGATYPENLFNRLLRYHYLKRPLALQPELLTEMPKLQKDGSYILTLRRGVFFHDADCFPGGKGRELTSDDVIYSFKRFADGRRKSDTFDRIERAIEGIDEFHKASIIQGARFRPDQTQISGLKKINSHQLSLRLTRVDGLRYLASPYLAIVPREAVEAYGNRFNMKPVGTGPYRLSSFVRGGTFVLEKNARYWETYPTEGNAPGHGENLLAYAGQQLPLINKVEVQYIPEMLPATLKYLKGDLDQTMIDHESFTKLVTKDGRGQFRLHPPYDASHKLISGTMNITYFFRVNMKDPILGRNKALREAIALGIDSQGYLDTLRHGRGEVANSLVPLASAGHARDSGATWYPHSLELAKQKMREAGYPDGKGLQPITMEYASTGQFHRQTHEYFRYSLAKIGIVLKPNFQTGTGFYKKVESGNFQLSWQGWDPDFADQAFQILTSKAGPIANSGSFASPEYDRVFEEMLQRPEGPARLSYVRTLNEIIKRELPLILIMHPYSAIIHHPKLRSVPTDVSELNDFRYLAWAP